MNGPVVTPRAGPPPLLGLYFDLRNPAPWRRDPAAHHARFLELVEDADRRGLGAVWVSEHHFLDDDHLARPLTMLAAVAARTSQCRLGTAVVVAPFAHPVVVAEQAALVDVLSAGRLELGIGAGYAPAEFATYGADPAGRYAATDALIAEVGRLLADGGVAPAPVQEPLPRWAGYLGPRGARRAGRLGVGLLTWNAERLDDYRAGRREGGHDPAGARMGGLLDFMVAEDPERFAARLLPHRVHQINSYRRLAAGPDRTPRVLTDDDVRAGRGSQVAGPLDVVTPDEAIARIRTIADAAPVTRLYAWGSIAGMPDDMVEHQLELLVGRVQPALG